MIIEVTDKDIAKGRRHDCSGCPIALAIKRKTILSVMVSDTMVSLSGYQYNLPEIAQEFIYNFDTRRPVKPFNFDLPFNP